MKKCFKCGETKSLSEFYRHPQMGDGYLGKCKQCARKDVIENREKRWEQYATYERNRYQKNGNRRKNPADPQKTLARFAVSNAVRDGRLIKQPCERCGSNTVQAHHDDYSRPLDVRWLCFTHHREHHGQMTAAARGHAVDDRYK